MIVAPVSVMLPDAGLEIVSAVGVELSAGDLPLTSPAQPASTKAITTVATSTKARFRLIPSNFDVRIAIPLIFLSPVLASAAQQSANRHSPRIEKGIEVLEPM